MELNPTPEHLESKRLLWERYRHSTQENIRSFYFEIFDLKLHYRIRSTHLPSVHQAIEVLTHHYHPVWMTKNSRTADIVVDIVIPESPWGDYNLELWNDPSPLLHLEKNTYGPKKELGDTFYHRDYMGWMSSDRKRYWVVLPQFDRNQTDSIDNLFMWIQGFHLCAHDALLVHSATVLFQDKAWVFFGQSGAGKSTLAQQSQKIDGLPVIGADQVFLKIASDGRLYAFPSPTRVFEFSKDHPALYTQPTPVAALIHLNGKHEFHWCVKNPTELLTAFVRESLHYQHDSNMYSKFLSLSCRMLQSQDIVLGEFGYSKGISFWNTLMGNIDRGSRDKKRKKI